jgi:hypothetical protein
MERPRPMRRGPEGGFVMHTWQRRTAGAIVAAVGVSFIVTVIVNSLFSVGPAFERMSGGFRPVMKPVPIAQLQTDLKGLSAVSTEFGTKAVPMLSQALKMDPAQFQAFMGQQYPAVAKGIQQLPAITQQFTGVVGTLQAEQARFAKADAIPTSNLPATTVPWGLFAAGVVLLALGLLVAFRPVRLWSWLAAAFGALLIIASLAISLPGKASAADTMNSHLKPVYTAQMLTGAKGALTVVGAMGTEMQTKMLPALGQQLGMDQAQLQGFFQQNLPAMAAGMQTMPQALGRFQNLLRTFDGHLADYNTLQPVSFVPIVWTMIIGGVVALFAGAFGLVARRKPEIQEVPVATLRAA